MHVPRSLHEAGGSAGGGDSPHSRGPGEVWGSRDPRWDSPPPEGMLSQGDRGTVELPLLVVPFPPWGVEEVRSERGLRVQRQSPPSALCWKTGRDKSVLGPTGSPTGTIQQALGADTRPQPAARATADLRGQVLPHGSSSARSAPGAGSERALRGRTLAERRRALRLAADTPTGYFYTYFLLLSWGRS